MTLPARRDSTLGQAMLNKARESEKQKLEMIGAVRVRVRVEEYRALSETQRLPVPVTVLVE